MRSHARRLAATSSGVHLLSSSRVIDGLVAAARLGPGDLVVDFGAGPGTITAPLVRTGARVLAVERDPRFVADLRRRFAGQPLVRVVFGDLRTVRLPRRAFAVVASIPFAVTTPLLRRLLTPPGGFGRGELVVEWGLAKRLTAARARDFESAWWATRFAFTVRRRIPARCFTPAPRVDAAHLAIRARSEVDRRTAEVLRAVLSTAYERPQLLARASLGRLVPHRTARRLLGDAVARDVGVEQWVELAQAVASAR